MNLDDKFRHAWWELSESHLEIAQLLLPQYAHAAYFHLYHAFECAACAALVKLTPGESLPYGHDDKLEALTAALGGGPLADTTEHMIEALARRNQSLYVVRLSNKVLRPAERFRSDHVQTILAALRAHAEAA